MARSYFRATFQLARGAVTHLLKANREHPHFRWQIGGTLIVAMTIFNLFANIPIAHAAGEQWSWSSKDALAVKGGDIAPANPVIDYQTVIYSSPSMDWEFVMASPTCTAKVHLNFSNDHKSVTVKATSISTPCVMSYANKLNGTYSIANSEQWTSGFGRITGRAMPSGCNQAQCGCPSATINVDRKSGTATGPTTVTTGGDGAFTLQIGQGQVVLSTPDCRKSDGSIWSGQTQTLTLKADQNLSQNVIADKQVGAAGSSDDVCDNANFTELNFWVCGFINLLSDTAKGLDDAVLSLLKIDTDTIFNDSGNAKSGNAFFLAWAAFRNIAYAILVLFALVMVASQILGMDFVDAYTFRKMLPRLVLAVVFIAISWNGLDFIFNLSNDAADAIRAIIAAPFNGIDVTIGSTVSNDLTLAILIPTLLTIGIPTGVAALALLGVGGIAALIGTIVLAVFSAWVLLVGRNVVAELLVIMSPIAIIFWAFGR